GARASDPTGAGGGGGDPARKVQQRGLAAAGGPADGDVVACFDAKRGVADGGHRTSLHGKHARQTARLDDRHDTTSCRSVCAIGRVVTSHTGYIAATAAVATSSNPCRTSACGSKTKQCRPSGRLGIRRRIRSSTPAS